MDESSKNFLRNIANQPQSARARRRKMERELKKLFKKYDRDTSNRLDDETSERGDEA